MRAGGFGILSWNPASLVLAPDSHWDYVAAFPRIVRSEQGEGESYIGLGALIVVAVILIAPPRQAISAIARHRLFSLCRALSPLRHFESRLPGTASDPRGAPAGRAERLVSFFRASARFVWVPMPRWCCCRSAHCLSGARRRWRFLSCSWRSSRSSPKRDRRFSSSGHSWRAHGRIGSTSANSAAGCRDTSGSSSFRRLMSAATHSRRYVSRVPDRAGRGAIERADQQPLHGAAAEGLRGRGTLGGWRRARPHHVVCVEQDGHSPISRPWRSCGFTALCRRGLGAGRLATAVEEVTSGSRRSAGW